MTLNIKDPEAHRLAVAIADRTGETLTAIVTQALKEQYDRLRTRESKPSVAELLAIAERARTGREGPFLDHAEFLYDQHGLPK